LKALVSWSSGKDSALALYAAVKAGYEILGLLTTVDVSSDPPVVTGHRVPLDLVERQAESLNLPLYIVELPGDLPPSHVYEKAILETLVRLKGELGVDYVVYGDIFLRDMMEYKRRLLQRVNMKPLYPLEGIDTVTLSEIILSLGFKAVVVAVDPRRTPRDLLCRDYDRRFLEELTVTVDPAGEYGEFHTFLYQAPLYRSPVNFKVGGVSTVRSEIGSIAVEKLVCNIDL
jgi:uncharacterized protein (TIGR00290 family)